MAPARIFIAAGSLALAVAPVPALASDFCSDVSYIVGLKGKLGAIATGPVFSPGQVRDIPGAAEQRTTFDVTGAYRCGVRGFSSDDYLYECDFASGGQNVVGDELKACYPAVAPVDQGSESKVWDVAGARIELTDYGPGYNVNLTIWPASETNSDDGDDDDDWPF